MKIRYLKKIIDRLPDDLDVEELLSRSDVYGRNRSNNAIPVNIASGTIIQEGSRCGYIEYTVHLTKLPKSGDVILMHDKYVGKIEKVEPKHNMFTIWVQTAYHKDEPYLDSELKHPTFDVNAYKIEIC